MALVIAEDYVYQHILLQSVVAQQQFMLACNRRGEAQCLRNPSWLEV